MAGPQLTLIDQPFGATTVGAVLDRELRDPTWSSFRAVVAFLKKSGLQHIAAPVDVFLGSQRHSATITVGIDHDGTSLEGVQDLWRAMNGRGDLFIFKEGQGGLASTFHPKLFLFESQAAALAIIGSSNFTQGGLFTNHEASVAIALDRADADSETFRSSLASALDHWQTPGPACRRVDASLLRELYAAGDLLSEANIAAANRASRAATRKGTAANTASRPPRFGASGAAPSAPSPPPLPQMASAPVVPSATPKPVRARPAPTGITAGAHSALLIEVRPHHNGEVFLSKIAVDSDPGFFGYPFTGWTVPKRSSNPPYPMASPDPAVELVVYDVKGRAVLRMPHSLNVVYYTLKSEIRITIPPAPLALIPDFSLLVMTRNPSPNLDYRLEFYPPACATPAVQLLRSRLTVRLPSGGASRARHYGWR